MASQSETILSKNHTQAFYSGNALLYSTATLMNTSQSHAIRDGGNGITQLITITHAVRPVINIGPDVQILGGNGTFNEPFQI